jgi:protein-disulfide isomerase-like protein with CxxC motif
MKLKKSDLSNLRKSLPIGSIAKIQARLLRSGKPFSVSYITQVLDSRDVRYNQVIIEEALLFAEEIRMKSKQMIKRISALNDDDY